MNEEPDLISLDITGFAHGGYGVARHDGRVVFVAAALPGESVLARVLRRRKRHWFASTETVLRASPDRVEPPCPLARPDRCGGCDLQHVSLARQRTLKAEVLTDQLARLGGVDMPVAVLPVPGDRDGLDWRTRVRYAITETGRVGFRRSGSREVIGVPSCPIASPEVRAAHFRGQAVTARTWSGVKEVVVAAGDTSTAVCPVPGGGAESVQERVLGLTFEVAATGFWQVHPGAATRLAQLVLESVPQSARVWDLYGGVGLFSKVLAERGQPEVTCVEGDRRATGFARRNLAGTVAEVVHADVRRWVGGRDSGVDVAILDPPRAGAGREVLAALSGSQASQIVYIACDPAALARDVRFSQELGWSLRSVVGLDMFPMTHHVEAVAVLER